MEDYSFFKMNAAGDTVILSRDAFEILLRKAGDEKPGPSSTGFTVLSNEHFLNLLKTSRDYDIVRKHLADNGCGAEQLAHIIFYHHQVNGTSDATLEVDFYARLNADAVNGNSPASSITASTTDDGFLTQVPQNWTPGGSFIGTPRASQVSSTFGGVSSFEGNGPRGAQNGCNSDFEYTDNGEVDYGSYYDPHDGQNHGFVQQEDMAYDQEYDIPGGFVKKCHRSLFLKNLHPHTTYSDVSAAVMGGNLLEIHFPHPQNPAKGAIVSFVVDADADNFLNYVTKKGLYIRGKRVLVEWAHNQVELKQKVVNQLGYGATRNILIHNATVRGHTEASIRADCEHIDNCVVISVCFVGQNGSGPQHALVEFNSISSAIHAKQCMIHRGGYKHLKIEWATDGCARSIPERTVLQPVRNERVQPQAPVNRYDVLRDGSTDILTPKKKTNGTGATLRGGEAPNDGDRLTAEALIAHTAVMQQGQNQGQRQKKNRKQEGR